MDSYELATSKNMCCKIALEVLMEVCEGMSKVELNAGLDPALLVN